MKCRCSFLIVRMRRATGYTLYEKKKLLKPLWPHIDGCADMGWQQKGSGRKRDSKSGHAATIAMLTQKPVALELCSKGCAFCKQWRTRHTIDEPPPNHRCFINHDGTYGSMEPLAVLRMYIKLYNKQVIIGRFVLDDNASTKSKLKWSNQTYMAKTGATRVPKAVNKNGNLAPRPTLIMEKYQATYWSPCLLPTQTTGERHLPVPFGNSH